MTFNRVCYCDVVSCCSGWWASPMIHTRFSSTYCSICCVIAITINNFNCYCIDSHFTQCITTSKIIVVCILFSVINLLNSWRRCYCNTSNVSCFSVLSIFCIRDCHCSFCFITEIYRSSFSRSIILWACNWFRIDNSRNIWVSCDCSSNDSTKTWFSMNFPWIITQLFSSNFCSIWWCPCVWMFVKSNSYWHTIASLVSILRNIFRHWTIRSSYTCYISIFIKLTSIFVNEEFHTAI